MESSLSWIDHDPEARERTLRILSLFQERESRDEMGIGSVRDSFADQLFPGTSTIQTRLRYMLFVPWLYRKLENERVPKEDFASQADKLERNLIQPLLASDDQAGVFGRTSGGGIKRLPSSVYWAGLVRWGIFRAPYPCSQNEYHGRIEEIYRERDEAASRKKEMAGLGADFEIDSRIVTWHPQIPPSPDGFPGKVDLALTRAEAEFIQDRIQSVCKGSLLAFLSRNCASTCIEAPWEHPDYNSFSDAHKELLHHARLFSETMHAAALNYNAQLAELCRNDERVSEYKKKFNSWLQKFPLEEVKSWRTCRLWKLTAGHGNIPPRTRRFVQSWIELVRESPEVLLENKHARKLVRDREMELKRSHSRFNNHRALELWGGKSGIGRLVYRWPNVKVFLNDLYQGMVKR